MYGLHKTESAVVSPWNSWIHYGLWYSYAGPGVGDALHFQLNAWTQEHNVYLC